jgi:hypothetical protein
MRARPTPLDLTARKPEPEPAESPPSYWLGLDLGQRKDFTALVCLQRTALPGATGPARWKYEARGVRRWPLGSAYTSIAADVAALVKAPPLAGCTLGADYTGCGIPIMEIVRAARPNATVRGVFITSGHAARFEAGTWFVPKVELCGVVAALLDSGRLAIPATLGPEAVTLGKELKGFKAKVTAAGNETMAAADWRLAQHDDLCMSLAIAAFLGERTQTLVLH